MVRPKPPAANPVPAEPESLSTTVLASSPSDEESAPTTWPDDAAESSFLAEARSRGETVTVPKPTEDAADDNDTRPLPPLNELVERIPPEVRDVLEDLFRARFVTVKRLPKRAFKS